MTKTKITTISELAELVGVSASTVSRALSGSALVSSKTRERIVGFANQYDFKPNELARNLRLKRTLSIGVVLPLGHEIGQNFSDPFFITMLGHLADGLTARGYDLVLSRVLPTDASWLNRIVRSGRIDGMVIIGQSNQSEVIEQVGKSYVPMVVWGADVPGKSYCSVGSDNRKGGKLATQYLINKGRKNLIFLGNIHAPEFAERQQGFADACEAANIAKARALDVHLTPEAAYKALVDHFGKGDLPDGIVAASDIVAMSAIRALTERRMNVPEDVSVIGYDDVPLAQHTTPPLTTIRQDLSKGAALLIELLFKRLSGEETGSVVIEPELIERGSA
ncbi:hypothetical protein MNBD_ALPHA04-289 [hydrothermal vent metagenome]|uniref:HTH lacI-type domain-containing protein n=1 Tax=hydrothermal vent metagenome TaxID=652676 RepID=A0A3B0S3K0_9ZZZZ